ICFIIILFIGVLAFVDIDPDIDMVFGKYHLNRDTLITIGKGMLQLSIVLIAGILMVSIGRTRKWITRCISWFPSVFFFASQGLRDRIASRISTPVVEIVENFATGFSLVKSPQKLAGCMGLSFCIWVLSAFSYYIMTLGCPGVDLSFLEITAVMIIICFVIALPSVPGFWGIWEAGGVFALSLFGISGQDAAGYTLVNHGVQMIPVMVVGLVSALIIGINILQVSYEKD
ncbi:MAG: lysylphosphatidylglycerol synthase transmembrane domain-containing protein, partial [Desulfobacterales bacterium]